MALNARRNGQFEGWLFPSDSEPGHLTTVTQPFEKARESAGGAKEIVFLQRPPHVRYEGDGATDDLSLVMRALGHTNAHTATIYQHPSLERVWV
jgi:hypothetical protein